MDPILPDIIKSKFKLQAAQIGTVACWKTPNNHLHDLLCLFQVWGPAETHLHSTGFIFFYELNQNWCFCNAQIVPCSLLQTVHNRYGPLHDFHMCRFGLLPLVDGLTIKIKSQPEGFLYEESNRDENQMLICHD